MIIIPSDNVILSVNLWVLRDHAFPEYGDKK